MTHNSFKDWVEKEVLPLQKKHPSWHRLDGLPSGGNRKVVGRFRYAGLDWVVHGDTRFDPVLRAYQAIKSGAVPNPFDIQRTKKNVRNCLELKPKLKVPNQPKYFYVYG